MTKQLAFIHGLQIEGYFCDVDDYIVVHLDLVGIENGERLRVETFSMAGFLFYFI